MLPEGDQLMARAERSVQALIEEDLAKFPSNANAKTKAEVYTYLAWQENAGLPLGLAVKAKYFDPKSPQAAIFIDWAKRVFEYEEYI